MVWPASNSMDDVFILNQDGTDAARLIIIRLHEAVRTREPDRPEAALSHQELLAQFRTADPTRNGSCLTWLLSTYAAGGYRLEYLSKAHDTLTAFARFRGYLPDTAIIDGETRNPRKLGSHATLASLWKAVALLVEEERLVQESAADERVDEGKERALEQSRVLYRSGRMVIAVPMTEEASCWWGQGTQWCTAARKNNAFAQYHKDAPLIIICLRKVGYLPARKLQLYVHASDMQFMDENDARVSPEIILERWQDLEALLYWAVGRNGRVLYYIPKHLCTEAICLAAVGSNGMALANVPEHLRTEVICSAAVEQNGWALEYVPEPLRTEAICLTAVGRNGRALHFVPEPLRTEAICTIAVGRDGYALLYVPARLRTEAICTVAVGRHGKVLYYVPEHLRTEAVCLTAVGENGDALEYVPKPLRTEAICLATVGSNGRALEFVPEPLRTEAICLVAVIQNGWSLHFVPEPLRTEEICTVAVVRNGGALEYVPEPLRTEAICLAAVTQTGWALKYVPNPLRTEAICLDAVSRTGGALEYVPEHLRTEAVCLVAVENNEQALAHVPNHLRTEAIQLVAKSYNECKTVLVNSEIHAVKSHDLVLVDLENHLNK